VIRVYLPDVELHTTRARGRGFRAVCDCSWQGHRTRNMREARAEMRWHRASVHGREQ
jgi:hypothetical protein